LLSFSTSIFVFALATGFISSTTFSLEHLYAQENSTGDGELMQDNELSSGDLSSGGGGGDISGGGGGGCSSGFYESNGECFPIVEGGCSSGFYESNGECFPIVEGGCSEGYVLEGEKCILEGGGISNGSQPQPGGNIPQPQPQLGGPGVNEIIDRGKGLIDPVKEKFANPEGFVEDTLNTINEKSPVPPLWIIGIVVVVAIGAGIASFSRHHHSHSRPSPSAQHQVKQDDTKEEQIYEDVQVVTQGGIEEV
jgi:hypothetical protein